MTTFTSSTRPATRCSTPIAWSERACGASRLIPTTTRPASTARPCTWRSTTAATRAGMARARAERPAQRRGDQERRRSNVSPAASGADAVHVRPRSRQALRCMRHRAAGTAQAPQLRDGRRHADPAAAERAPAVLSPRAHRARESSARTSSPTTTRRRTAQTKCGTAPGSHIWCRRPSRDLLVSALLNLDAAGFDIVLHVHDEIVAEIDPANIEHDRERFKACMLAAPTGRTGCRSRPRCESARATSRPTNRSRSQHQHRSSQWFLSSPQLRFGRRCPAILHRLKLRRQHRRRRAKRLRARQLRQRDLSIAARHRRRAAGAQQGALSVSRRHEAVVPHLPRPLSLLRLRRPRRRHQLVDGGRGPELHCRAGCARLLGTATAAGRRARRRRQEAGARAKLWDAAKPIAGTRAVDYLTFRAIDVDQLAGGPTRRRCAFTRIARSASASSPCLLALFQDIDTDAFAGIHRIALTPSAFAHCPVRSSAGCWAAGHRAAAPSSCGRRSAGWCSAKGLKQRWRQPPASPTRATRCARRGRCSPPARSRRAGRSPASIASCCSPTTTRRSAGKPRRTPRSC